MARRPAVDSDGAARTRTRRRQTRVGREPAQGGAAHPAGVARGMEGHLSTFPLCASRLKFWRQTTRTFRDFGCCGDALRDRKRPARIHCRSMHLLAPFQMGRAEVEDIIMAPLKSVLLGLGALATSLVLAGCATSNTPGWNSFHPSGKAAQFFPTRPSADQAADRSH